MRSLTRKPGAEPSTLIRPPALFPYAAAIWMANRDKNQALGVEAVCGDRPLRPRCRNRPPSHVSLLMAFSHDPFKPPSKGRQPHDDRSLVPCIHGDADGGALDSVHCLPGDDERPSVGGKLRRPSSPSRAPLGSACSPRLSQRGRMFRAIRRACDRRSNRWKDNWNDGLLGDELFLAPARARHRLLGRYPLPENRAVHLGLRLRRRDVLAGDQVGSGKAGALTPTPLPLPVERRAFFERPLGEGVFTAPAWPSGRPRPRGRKEIQASASR